IHKLLAVMFSDPKNIQTYPVCMFHPFQQLPHRDHAVFSIYGIIFQLCCGETIYSYFHLVLYLIAFYTKLLNIKATKTHWGNKGFKMMIPNCNDLDANL